MDSQRSHILQLHRLRQQFQCHHLGRRIEGHQRPSQDQSHQMIQQIQSQFMVQAKSIGITIIWCGVISFILFKIIDATMHL